MARVGAWQGEVEGLAFYDFAHIWLIFRYIWVDIRRRCVLEMTTITKAQRLFLSSQTPILLQAPAMYLYNA